jgi:hypothetical protein
MVAGRLTDGYSTVRFAAMDCLREYPDACEAVSGAIPLLLELARDNPQTALAAFAAIDSISKITDFAELAFLFRVLSELIPDLPPQIAGSAFASFASLQGK